MGTRSVRHDDKGCSLAQRRRRCAVGRIAADGERRSNRCHRDGVGACTRETRDCLQSEMMAVPVSRARIRPLGHLFDRRVVCKTLLGSSRVGLDEALSRRFLQS
jgi:hypothetical protein